MATYTLGAVTHSASGIKVGVAGAAIAAGEWIYRKTADSLLYLADADAADTDAHVPLGVAIGTAAIGQVVAYLDDGALTTAAGVFSAAGKVLALSSTAGACCDVASVGAGSELTLVGWSTGTAALRIKIVPTEITL